MPYVTVARVGIRTEIGRQLALAGCLLIAVAAVGATGYHALGAGRWGWGDCLYMTVITLSTVGFGELLPGMNATAGARGWTLGLILIGSGTIVFFVSSLTAFIVEGDIQGVLRRRRMQKQVDQLRDHVIVVGVGATGIHVVAELIGSKVPFVVIETSSERLELVAEQLGASIPHVHGDATLDSVLEQAGVVRAKGLVATLREDKDNVFVTITARALNPKLRIVAKITEDNAETKLRRAGADSTVSPSLIGGLRMASELVRPSVVQFLDRMRSHDLRVEELPIPEGSSLVGQQLRDAKLRHQTSVLVLAVRMPDGSYSYNPGPAFLLELGQTLVVLCRSDDLEQLRRGIARGTSGPALD